MSIRKAAPADLPALEALYDRIHTATENGLSPTGWVRGVYPTKATILDALARNDMFVMEANDAIAGAGIINNIQVDVYKDMPWQYPAAADEVMVLHTLVIDPAIKGKGLGRAFVDFYADYARRHGAKYLRLDTNAINLPARAFYKKLGFAEVGFASCDFNGIGGVKLVMLEKKL